ncbi:MAG: hypothetical protein ACOC56_05085 [Atribacterota bacterium]
MGIEKYKNKRVIIELKNPVKEDKYRGTITEIDTSPKYWSWVTLKQLFFDKQQQRYVEKYQTFSDSEIKRVEVLE